MSFINKEAELISAKQTNTIFNALFLHIERNSVVSAEKKIMYEETAIEDNPAFFIESTKSNDCPELS